jgi:5-(carboxyamino)imidazole ribonucleotide mutase
MIEVGIVMGSNSDWEVMQNAARVLKDFGVAFETRVVSAHRTPDLLFQYAETAAERGLKAIIAGAGGAAHLPGMLAAKTHAGAGRAGAVQIPAWRGFAAVHRAMPKGIPATHHWKPVPPMPRCLPCHAGQRAGTGRELIAFRKRQEETVLGMTLPEVE